MNLNYNISRFLKNEKCGNLLLLFIFICGFILGLLFRFLNKLRKKVVKIKKVFVNYNLNCECKMIFCVRTDLKMNKGKMCSQCCHACLSIYEKILKRNNQLIKKNNLNKNNSFNYFDFWKRTGQKKIVLKISSLEEMYEIEEKAKKENLLTSIIIDAGRTQIEPNTPTVIAIEPVPDEIVNKITGQLKLL